MFLELNNVGKRYGRTWVLRRVGLRVEAGEFLCVVGPSGAGKTTLLSLIAGFAAPDEGGLTFGRVPDQDNPVIMVHQDFLLFPHLSVRQNVGFGLEARGLSGRDRDGRVAEMLEYFHIADKAGAYPAKLSAGQRQRVALARALAVRPALLLLDEPFANLDPGLSTDTAGFIRATQKGFGVTTICVTHDLEEACLMSDRLGVMLGGELVQTGRAEDVFANPAGPDVAAFLGPLNRIPADTARLAGLGDGSADVLVRPEGLSLSPDPAGPGEILQSVFAGRYVRYRVGVAGCEFLVFGPPPGLAPGTRVRPRPVAGN